MDGDYNLLYLIIFGAEARMQTKLKKYEIQNTII